MLFALKKFIGSALLPLPFCLSVMAIALILLWFTRWQKTGKTLMTVSWATLLLLSLQPVADRLLLPLETRYATFTGDKPYDYIVVLGGGYTYNPQWAPSSNLINNSLPRLTEGIRLSRENPEAKLIFTGGNAEGNPVSSAQVAASVAISLGVKPEQIILVDDVRDTAQESRAVAAIVKESPFLLVTSANHMPRALVWFQQLGLQPIAAPANQLAITSALNPWERVFPSPYYLMHSERAWYETLGTWWQNLNSPPATDNK